jgi:hypothetical protein
MTLFTADQIDDLTAQGRGGGSRLRRNPAVLDRDRRLETSFS